MQGPAFSGWLLAHDMRATRFSGFRKSGFLRSGVLIAPCLLASLSATSLASAQTPQAATRQAQHQNSPSGKAPPAPASTPAVPQPAAAPHKKLTRPEQIAALADQLVQAKTPEDAQMLEARLEALRAAGLSPTTQLLLRRAEKDSQADKPDEAVEDLSDALALQPDSAILWRSRAQMRLAAGDFSAAITDLGEALQRDSRDAKSWGLLSTVEDQRKDGPAALKAWQKVLELNPMADKNHKHLDALHIKAFGQPT